MRLAANGACAAKVSMANQQALDVRTSCTSNNNKLHGREKNPSKLLGKIQLTKNKLQCIFWL
jgi:hypothetical protein